MPKFQNGHPGGPGRPRGSRNAPQDAAALTRVLDTHRRTFELVAQQTTVDALETEMRKIKEGLK